MLTEYSLSGASRVLSEELPDFLDGLFPMAGGWGRWEKKSKEGGSFFSKRRGVVYVAKVERTGRLHSQQSANSGSGAYANIKRNRKADQFFFFLYLYE